MQIQSSTSGQTQAVPQMQQTQVRKMDGSGNGMGLRNGSNCTTPVASTQSSAPLPSNSTFATYA